ncbi:MAG: hypothetical protein ACJAWV_001378 [Flammeovirgaceae bacterium]|jgi:hypothetical protein
MAVEIKLFVEGGVLNSENVNIQTINNTVKLRESFYKLFAQSVDPSVFRLEVYMGASDKNTAKLFKNDVAKKADALLLIDLDAGIYKDKAGKLKALDLVSISNRVFFMVQEMEAWILSQPDKIEECFYYLKRVKENLEIADDNTIKDKDIEKILKPSEKLKVILGRYFLVEKKGKQKKKKYDSKLKDGSDLLMLLDSSRLRKSFEDVNNLLIILESYHQKPDNL